LRECERARVFKALRKEIEILRELDARRRRIVASVYVRMHEFNLSLGGRVALPAPAAPKAERPEVNVQHSSQTFAKLITPRLTRPFLRIGLDFFGGSHEHR
jgi:hypothetical protein